VSVIERFEAEGVEGIRVGRWPIGINTSVIVYRLGETLIDTGPANMWGAVRRFVAEKPVARVLLTHHHEDHSGNAAHIAETFGVPVYAPAEGLTWLAQGYRIHAYRRFFWGVPACLTAEALPEEVALEGGRRLRVVHTAGHAVDQTCLLEPEQGWLFTGDVFIASTMRYMRTDEIFDEILDSLRRVLELSFDTIFCAHRGVVRHGHAAIQAKLDGLKALREQARALQHKGRSTNSITRRLLGSEDIVTWLTWGHFSKRNLIRGCIESRESYPSR